MKAKLVKIVRGVAKVSLFFSGITLLLLLGYYTYRAIKFKPYKVRVSNVTDSAFTVSWITDEPMTGIVYYGEKDSFLPGPLAWLGKKRAVDDRDISMAQKECVAKFNKKALKTRDENFTVDASDFDCNDVKVLKRNQYYTHHVTIQNLDADKEYFFRVGNGYINYKQGKSEGVGYIGREMPAVSELKQKTRPLIKSVGSPNPAYGTSFNLYSKGEGVLGKKTNFDSIIFLQAFKEEEEYGLMSAACNSDGGWSIDLGNLRDANNDLVEMSGTHLEFIPQVENAQPGASGARSYNSLKFPLSIMGNSEYDWEGDVNSGNVIKLAEAVKLFDELIGKSYAAPSCFCSNEGGCASIPRNTCTSMGGTCYITKSSCCTASGLDANCNRIPSRTCYKDSCPASVTPCGSAGSRDTHPVCKKCYKCEGGELREEYSRPDGSCNSGYTYNKPNCTVSSVDCFCTSNSCAPSIKKEGRSCNPSQGCYAKKVDCIDANQGGEQSNDYYWNGTSCVSGCAAKGGVTCMSLDMCNKTEGGGTGRTKTCYQKRCPVKSSSLEECTGLYSEDKPPVCITCYKCGNDGSILEKTSGIDGKCDEVGGYFADKPSNCISRTGKCYKCSRQGVLEKDAGPGGLCTGGYTPIELKTCFKGGGTGLDINREETDSGGGKSCMDPITGADAGVCCNSSCYCVCADPTSISKQTHCQNKGMEYHSSLQSCLMDNEFWEYDSSVNDCVKARKCTTIGDCMKKLKNAIISYNKCKDIHSADIANKSCWNARGDSIHHPPGKICTSLGLGYELNDNPAVQAKTCYSDRQCDYSRVIPYDRNENPNFSCASNRTNPQAADASEFTLDEPPSDTQRMAMCGVCCDSPTGVSLSCGSCSSKPVGGDCPQGTKLYSSHVACEGGGEPEVINARCEDGVVRCQKLVPVAASRGVEQIVYNPIELFPRLRTKVYASDFQLGRKIPKGYVLTDVQGSSCGEVSCSGFTQQKEKINIGLHEKGDLKKPCNNSDGCDCFIANVFAQSIVKGDFCSRDLLNSQNILVNEKCLYPKGCTCTDPFFPGFTSDVENGGTCTLSDEWMKKICTENALPGKGELLDFSTVCRFKKGCSCPYRSKDVLCGEVCSDLYGQEPEYGVCYDGKNNCSSVRYVHSGLGPTGSLGGPNISNIRDIKGASSEETNNQESRKSPSAGRCKSEERYYDTLTLCKFFSDPLNDQRACYFKPEGSYICFPADRSACYRSNGKLREGFIPVGDIETAEEAGCSVVDPYRPYNYNNCENWRTGVKIGEWVIEKGVPAAIGAATVGTGTVVQVSVGAITDVAVEKITDEISEEILAEKCSKAYYCHEDTTKSLERPDRLTMVDKDTAKSKYGCNFRTNKCSAGKLRSDIGDCVPFEQHYCTNGSTVLPDIHAVGEEPVCKSGFRLLSLTSADPIEDSEGNKSVCVSLKKEIIGDKGEASAVMEFLTMDLGWKGIKKGLSGTGKKGKIVAEVIDFVLKKDLIPGAVSDAEASVVSWEHCVAKAGVKYIIDEAKDYLDDGVKDELSGFLPLDKKFIKKTYAQVPQDDEKVLYFPTPGVYRMNSAIGEQEIVSEGNETRAMYLERNGVPGYQPPVNPIKPREDEDVFISHKSLGVSVSKEITAQNISLKQGVNIISFDFAPSKSGGNNLTSHEFLRLVNKDVRTVSHITYFEGSQWAGGTRYDFINRKSLGDDFEITFGKGYAVIVERDSVISVPGYAIKEPVPIAFSEGWNLVGVNGPRDKAYTAKSFIDSINSIEGLKANNVTYWPTSKGRYEGFQVSEGQTYGQDFPISKDLGYFVRINEYSKPECKSLWWNPGGKGNAFCDK